jgi:LuxR family maltose regulon positive regulatory protein
VLADHVPDGSRLAFTGRAEPPVRIARLRAEGKILEIGPGDLSLTREEAALLLRAAGTPLGGEDVAELHTRTEGWAAGLYLAALYLREGGSLPQAAVSFSGGDRREAVLERPSSAAILADVARSNLLLVPLDRRGQWYRYHHLFRDMLLAELEREEPGLIPVLRRRAASWCVRNDRPEEALEYSIAAGDVSLAAKLIEKLGTRTYQQGRRTTLQRWLGWLEERGGSAERLMVPVMAAIICALTGQPGDADRWAVAVDRWRSGDANRPDDPAGEAWAAQMRAMLCRNGIEQMRADADEAVRRSAVVRSVATAAALYQGIARVLSGDLDGADASFRDAVQAGEQIGTPESVLHALPQRSLLAITRNQWSQAEAPRDAGRRRLGPVQA